MTKPFVVQKVNPFEIQPYYIGGEDEKIVENEQKEPIRPFVIETYEKSMQDVQKNENGIKMIRPIHISEEFDTLVQTETDTNISTATPEQKVIQNEDKKEVIKEAFQPVSNYVLIPIEKVIFIDREGCEDVSREKIRFVVKINGEEPKNMEIRTVEICKIAKLVGARFSTAIIDSGETKAEKIVEEEFRKKTRGIRIIRCYTDAGWQKINGTMQYVHDDCDVCNGKVIMTGLNLPSFQCEDIQLKKWINKALHLYDEPVAMSTMFLFAFSGVMYRIFAECGHEPHFLLFLNGKTGSMKTTLAKILYQQLVQEQHREHVRRIDTDTVVSFERVIVNVEWIR